MVHSVSCCKPTTSKLRGLKQQFTISHNSAGWLGVFPVLSLVDSFMNLYLAGRPAGAGFSWDRWHSWAPLYVTPHPGLLHGMVIPGQHTNRTKTLELADLLVKESYMANSDSRGKAPDSTFWWDELQNIVALLFNSPQTLWSWVRYLLFCHLHLMKNDTTEIKFPRIAHLKLWAAPNWNFFYRDSGSCLTVIVKYINNLPEQDAALGIILKSYHHQWFPRWL